MSTPMESGLQLSPAETNDVLIPYRSATGSLMFLAESTRPDIAYSVHRLAQFGSSYDDTHWSALKRIFRYLTGTIRLGVSYRYSISNTIHGMSDSNWGGLMGDKCKSTSGYVFYAFDSLVSWSSRKQPTVALSLTEAEYIALCNATTQALWLRQVLHEIKIDYESPIRLSCDNTSAVHAAENPSHHGRMKHIDIKYHFVGESIHEHLIRRHRVQSAENVADILTKPLPRPSFVKLRNLVNTDIADTQEDVESPVI